MLTTEKLDRINRAIDQHKAMVDELVLKSARPQLGGCASTAAGAALQHKAAFEAYVRHGEANGLHMLEEKALSVGSGPDGGYLVPAETEAAVIRGREEHLADPRHRRQPHGERVRLQEAVRHHRPGARAGWRRRRRGRRPTRRRSPSSPSRPWSSTPCRRRRRPCSTTPRSISTSGWPRRSSIAFAQQEGTAFVSGDGINKPKGFLDYTKVANGSWSWGKIGYVATGTDGGFDAEDPSDDLIDLIYALKSEYRANAHWVMNRATQAAIRKFKDADGNYIWQPAERADLSPTLMNYPIAESEDMPNIGSDCYSIAFGDFQPRLSRRRPRRHPRACAIPIPPSPTCCSTRPSASAAACRTSTRSSS